MKVAKKELPKNQVELTIELSVEEFQPYLDQAVATISRETSIAGFRPGKAPYQVVAKQVGLMRIHQNAAEAAVQKSFVQAVEEQKIYTIGAPKISVQKIAPNNPFVYQATVALLPKVTLGDYKSISAEKREVAVEDKDVEATVENLRKMFGKEKKVLRPAKQGDKVEVDMDVFMDKVPIDGGKAKQQTITIGEGAFIPGFEEQLIGMNAGETREFTISFPKEYHRKDLAGKPAEFKVTVHTVFEIELPALDDAFAKQAGKFENLDALKSQIKQNIKQEKAMKEEQRWELAVIDKLIKSATFGEIPDILVNSELDKMIHELEHQVNKQGMKFDDYLKSIKKSVDDLKLEFTNQAIRRVKTALALREIANQEKISVSDQEAKEKIEQQKKMYQQQPEMQKQLDSPDYHDYVKNMLRSQKVFALFKKEM